MEPAEISTIAPRTISHELASGWKHLSGMARQATAVNESRFNFLKLFHNLEQTLFVQFRTVKKFLYLLSVLFFLSSRED